MERVVLSVDAMGGDNAPECVLEGISGFLDEFEDTDIRLFGRSEKINAWYETLSEKQIRVTLMDAPDVITMEDEPMLAVRRKGDSSLMLGLKDVKAGLSNGFVSAGSTGALMLGSMVTLRCIKGISRPALAPVMPGLEAPFLLLDTGANADCQSEYLNLFGLMGSVYMNKVMGVPNPRVGLVNIGTEEEKGSKLYKEAHALMKNQTAYTFAGNLEARDIQYGKMDVAVADGFTGNVILKYAEGFAKCMLKTLKTEIMSTTKGKIGGLLLKPAFANVKKQLNADEYGGAPLLGIDGVVVKAHGSSNGYAFGKALAQARKMVLGNVVDTLKQGLIKIQDTEA